MLDKMELNMENAVQKPQKPLLSTILYNFNILFRFIFRKVSAEHAPKITPMSSQSDTV